MPIAKLPQIAQATPKSTQQLAPKVDNTEALGIKLKSTGANLNRDKIPRQVQETLPLSTVQLRRTSERKINEDSKPLEALEMLGRLKSFNAMDGRQRASSQSGSLYTSQAQTKPTPFSEHPLVKKSNDKVEEIVQQLKRSQTLVDVPPTQLEKVREQIMKRSTEELFKAEKILPPLPVSTSSTQLKITTPQPISKIKEQPKSDIIEPKELKKSRPRHVGSIELPDDEAITEIKDLLKSQMNVSSNHEAGNRSLIVAAVESYNPSRAVELQFDEGDMLLVTDSSNPEWWVARHEMTGKVGLVKPSKVQEMDTFFAEIVAQAEENLSSQSGGDSLNSTRGRSQTNNSSIMNSWKNDVVPRPAADRRRSRAITDDMSWAARAGSDRIASLSKDDLKRQESINEYIETERKFVDDMEMVQEGYVKPLLDSRVVTEAELNEMFSNLAQVVQVSKEMLSELLERSEKTLIVDKIGDILVKQLPNMNKFAPFCANMSRSVQFIIEKKKVSPPFVAKLQECQKHEYFRNLDLNSFLLKPMQRITKLPLLIKGIMKYTQHDHEDYRDLAEAEAMSQEILLHINNMCGNSEERRKLEKMRGKLNFDLTQEVQMDFFEPKKRKIVYGSQVDIQGKKILMFLFDDVLLFIQTKLVNKIERYTLYKPMFSLWLVEVDVPGQPENPRKRTSIGGLKILNKKQSVQKDNSKILVISDVLNDIKYEVCCTNMREKDAWLDAFERTQGQLDTVLTCDRVKRLPTTCSYKDIKKKQSLEYNSLAVVGDYVLLGHSEGVYCSRNGESEEFHELPGFQQGVSKILVEPISLLIIMQDIKTGRLDAYSNDSMLALLKHVFDPSKKGSGPGLKLIKLPESDGTGEFGATFIQDTLYVVTCNPSHIVSYQFESNKVFRIVNSFENNELCNMVNIVNNKFYLALRDKFYSFDAHSGQLNELADPVSQNDGQHALQCFSLENSTMLLCFSNMGLIVDVYKNRIRVENILVWRYYAASFSLEAPLLKVFVRNAIEIWNIQTKLLAQIVHTPNSRVLNPRNPPVFSVSDQNDTGSWLSYLKRE